MATENSELTGSPTFDIIDEFQQDADCCTDQEISETFPYRYHANKKIALTEGFHASNSYVQLVANNTESTLAAANKKGEISLVDVNKGVKSSSFDAHGKAITGLRFCPINSNLLYSSSLDNTIKLRDIRTNKFEHTYEHKDEEGKGLEFTCVDVNSSGEFLCSGTSATSDEIANLVFWDVRKSSKLLGGYSESHSDDITSVNFHPNKRQRLMSAAMDNLINVYDISKKSESDAFSHCINFETTPDSVHWDPHADHQNNLFAVNYPQTIQYWDINSTVPTANYGAKRLCKSIKRQRPEQCHLLSLNFNKDSDPLLMISSNLGCETQEDACIRTLCYNRDKKKAKPHSVLELDGNKIVQVFHSLYLSSRDTFVTLEAGSLRYWIQKGNKRTFAGSSNLSEGKKRKQ